MHYKYNSIFFLLFFSKVIISFSISKPKSKSANESFYPKIAVTRFQTNYKYIKNNIIIKFIYQKYI